MNFKEIVGHEKNIEALKRALKNKSLSHSYLFEGEDSIGKKMVALAFSKAILCEEDGDEPCDRC